MPYFALIENSKVKKIHVVADAALIDENGEPDEALGQVLLESLHGIPANSWVQCSLEGEFRGSRIGIGFTYDSERDAFIPPKPYDSWVLDEDTCLWVAPLPYPEDGASYYWNEELFSWELAEVE